MRIREIASTRVRYGYKRIHVLLKREGWQINHKRVHRLYFEDGLNLRVKDELNDPRKADQLYDSAVRWLPEYTRDKRRYPILFKENISYGFRRNCYGIEWLAVILALMPTIVVAVDLLVQNVSIVSVGELTTWVSICFSVVLFTWWAFVVRAKWVRDAARAYALRL